MNERHDGKYVGLHRWSGLLALTTATLIACGSSAPSPAGPPGTGPGDGSTTQDDAKLAAPPGTETEVASSAATGPIAAAPPKKSPFIAVAQHDAALRLFAVDGALLVVPDNKYYEPLRMGVVDGDEIELLDRLGTSWGFAHVVAIGGKWPNKLDMLVTGDTGRTGIAQRYTLTPNGWKDHSSRMGERYVGMAAINDGMVALTAPIMFGSPSLFAMYGSTGPQRRLTPPPKSCIPEGAQPGGFGAPGSALMPSGLGSTKNGTLIAVGEHCKGGAVLETWAPGAKTSKFIEIPGVTGGGDWDDNATVVAGAGPEEAYVLNGYVAHVVGDKVELIEDMGGIKGGVTPDGTLWTFSDGRVLKYADGAVEVVSAPNGVALDDMVVASDGMVWATGNGALFRLRRENETGQGVAIETKKKHIPAVFRLPRPGGPQCSNNLVVLYGFTKVTPVDYDFPLTRKALKGHTEFADVTFAVTEDNGKKYLTGATPSFDMAKKLMKHIEKGVKGARPTVVCVEPKVIRPFPLDLRTGELEP